MFNPLAAQNINETDPRGTPGCFRFEDAWWVCAQYPDIPGDKVSLPAGGLAVLGGAPWKTTPAVTEAGGVDCELSLVGAPDLYISGLVDVLRNYHREIRAGDYIWLNRRWDDGEPLVLRVRCVRHRPELGVIEEIARRSGAYFIQPSTSDQLCRALVDALVLPQSTSTWNDVVSRLDERGDTRLALLVRHYVDSGCDASLTLEPEAAPDEVEEVVSTPNVMDFLQLINGGGR